MSEQQVQSPLPGLFYLRPAPDQPPFVEVGSVVTADQSVGLVEVMKQFAEVKAGVAGTVTAILVDDAAVVGPGDPVMTIETSD
nr:accB [Aeromicrobium sp.]